MLAFALALLAQVDAGVAPASVPAAEGPVFLDVTFDPDGLHTGRAELLVVTVPERAPPMRSLVGRLGKRAVVALPASPDQRRWYVLAPVPIEAKPEPMLLSLSAALSDGTLLGFDKPVPVVLAPYDERELSVPKRFVQPSLKDRRRAAREARIMDRVMAQVSPDRLWRGSFAKPTAGGETSPFGTRRTYNKRTKSRHMGWDLDGKVGDAIVATNRGKVVLSADRFYSGGTVVVDHGQGLFTLYFHMSKRAVQVGQLVEKGELLGNVGATGRVTGPHLHFTFKLSGESLDPKFALALDLSADAHAARESAGEEARQPVVEAGHVEEQQGDIPEVDDVP